MEPMAQAVSAMPMVSMVMVGGGHALVLLLLLQLQGDDGDCRPRIGHTEK
jgi:hypothetical protein